MLFKKKKMKMNKMIKKKIFLKKKKQKMNLTIKIIKIIYKFKIKISNKTI